MFEIKLRRGEVMSVMTEDGYELLIEAVDIGNRRVLLSCTGPHHFKVTRQSRGVKPDKTYTQQVGDEASHENYLRKLIQGSKDDQTGS